MDSYQIIQKIRLSEKASIAGETNNEYVFEVHPKANKIQIRQAVTQAFGKKVTEVRTMRYDGKLRRQRRADQGTTKSWKKAVVRLAEGEKIELI
jgi:large subunit ribosomal protein L23